MLRSRQSPRPRPNRNRHHNRRPRRNRQTLNTRRTRRHNRSPMTILMNTRLTRTTHEPLLMKNFSLASKRLRLRHIRNRLNLSIRPNNRCQGTLNRTSQRRTVPKRSITTQATRRTTRRAHRRPITRGISNPVNDFSLITPRHRRRIINPLTRTLSRHQHAHNIMDVIAISRRMSINLSINRRTASRIHLTLRTSVLSTHTILTHSHHNTINKIIIRSTSLNNKRNHTRILSRLNRNSHLIMTKGRSNSTKNLQRNATKPYKDPLI